MTVQVAPGTRVSVRPLAGIRSDTPLRIVPQRGAARRQPCARRRASTTRAVYAWGSLAKEEPKPFLLKVAVVREDLGEGMPAHGVHGDAVGEAIVLIRAPFIQREALQE